MAEDTDSSLALPDLPEIVRKIRARTPARLLVGRAGAAYRTRTQLELREAHAAARDAVRAELNLEAGFGAAFLEQWQLLETRTKAETKDEYLLRPDLGRRLDDASRANLLHQGTRDSDLQVAIGDGLSATAVVAQVPSLLPLLMEGAASRGWKAGRTIAIRHSRVGVINEIGELLNPRVIILLIGERPGLATADSLSAYMAHRSRASDTDARRNLISNIHRRGISTQDAAARILNLAARMMETGSSGFALREELPKLGQD